MIGVCRRCHEPAFSTDQYATICDGCTQTLRDDAAISGAAIAAHSETLTDHRSPGERLRED